jgi:hypothetical protein
MDSSISPKNEILFLRVCHHISTGFYHLTPAVELALKMDDSGIPVLLTAHACCGLSDQQ